MTEKGDSMHRIRIVATLLFAALLGSCAQTATVPANIYSASHPAPNFDLIVPGQRVGPIYLGMTAKDLYRTMGTPTGSYTDTSLSLTSYDFGPGNGKNGQPYTEARLINGIVTGISTSERRFHTGDKLTIGSPDLAVRATKGNPECELPGRMGEGEEYLEYHNVSFVVRRGAVTFISVAQNNNC